MMISQPALICLEATWQRLLGRRIAGELSAGTPAPNLSDVVPTVVSNPISDGRTVAELASVRPIESVEVKSSPDEVATPSDDAPLTADERRARAAALRALALSRGRRFDAARAAFTEAARLDSTLDLTRTPAFWKLERAAHEAAIEAYLATGRDGDAAVLRARVRSTYRPKAMRTRSGPALSS
jgi:hypothetical protein